MMVLVVGASGATGRLLVKGLIARGEKVRVIVRSRNVFLRDVVDHENLSIVQASILQLSDAELNQCVSGVAAIASCLGHNLSISGMFAPPRRLVTDATRRLCAAVRAAALGEPVKFLLMNTAGNSNADLHEQISFPQKCVIALIRLLLPPHVDNEQAAEYLRVGIGQTDPAIEWVVVRPDALQNNHQVTDYTLHASPTRSAVFDAGKTSRINVADFMAKLMTDPHMWHEWKGKMPVIYDKESNDDSNRGLAH